MWQLGGFCGIFHVKAQHRQVFLVIGKMFRVQPLCSQNCNSLPTAKLFKMISTMWMFFRLEKTSWVTHHCLCPQWRSYLNLISTTWRPFTVYLPETSPGNLFSSFISSRNCQQQNYTHSQTSIFPTRALRSFHRFSSLSLQPVNHVFRLWGHRPRVQLLWS